MHFTPTAKMLRMLDNMMPIPIIVAAVLLFAPFMWLFFAALHFIAWSAHLLMPAFPDFSDGMPW
jgi:hypothetical protein